ncbi:MAG TPA: ATP-binding protein [Vicinamibacterales bacterium]|nr:ATP-binding protein [Vicinamibacterales bacterium]
MIGLSIRARLTAWFVAVLAVATVTLTVASWWFSTQSVIRAADVSLQARLDGVRQFLENPRTRLTVEGLRDEFGEYAELTRGEALLEVVDATGVVLVRPAIPGWKEMAATKARLVGDEGVVADDRMIGRLPYRVAFARIDALGATYDVTVAAPMGPAYEALNRFHQLLFLLLPAVLALAGAGGYWISRRALAPVDQITGVVQAITLQSLDQRVEVPTADDEIRRLALTFNALLTRLQSAVGDIVRFTADASHELRTPVALVRTTAELALRRERTPHDYRTALSEVLDHTRRMSALVDDLLIMARADAGIEGRRDAVFDLRACVVAAGHEAAALGAGRHVTLDVDVPGHALPARGDAVSLRRLLLIVLDNAVKYSPGGGRVAMALSHAAGKGEGTAMITVSDDGIGLDAADVPRLFERFYRGRRARQHAAEGHGLGLAIARDIARRHHWGLSVRPRQEGAVAHGCTVEVQLPLDAGPACLEDPAEARAVMA